MTGDDPDRAVTAHDDLASGRRGRPDPEPDTHGERKHAHSEQPSPSLPRARLGDQRLEIVLARRFRWREDAQRSRSEIWVDGAFQLCGASSQSTGYESPSFRCRGTGIRIAKRTAPWGAIAPMP